MNTLALARRRTSIMHAAIWITALQVLDIVTTYTAIAYAGAEEGNPVTKWMVDTYVIVLVKLAVAAFVLWMAARPKPVSRWLLWVAWFDVALYSLVVTWNASHLVVPR